MVVCILNLNRTSLGSSMHAHLGVVVVVAAAKLPSKVSVDNLLQSR